MDSCTRAVAASACFPFLAPLLPSGRPSDVPEAGASGLYVSLAGGRGRALGRVSMGERDIWVEPTVHVPVGVARRSPWLRRRRPDTLLTPGRVRRVVAGRIHHPRACRLGLGLVRGSGSGTRSRVVTGLLGEGPVPPVGGDGLPSLYFYPPIGVCHARRLGRRRPRLPLLRLGDGGGRGCRGAGDDVLLRCHGSRLGGEREREWREERRKWEGTGGKAGRNGGKRRSTRRQGGPTRAFSLVPALQAPPGRRVLPGSAGTRFGPSWRKTGFWGGRLGRFFGAGAAKTPGEGLLGARLEMLLG
ncbi:uncharacterized protein [Triticum aestivum]|uniref:uncharacterized protein n=1 Tax=Triticum aestivum TaxID=4565 RepID=UPI001D020A2C|nr:uncharacterized protein LOC123164273 [Triticum aestivum]